MVPTKSLTFSRVFPKGCYEVMILVVTLFLARWTPPRIWEILLMEEIRLSTWDVKNLVKNGTDCQPQLVSRISSINSMDPVFVQPIEADIGTFWVD